MSDNTAVVKLNGTNAPEPGMCGAKLRRSDPPRYCKRPPINGRTRCRLHGGASLVGAESGTWKGKGFSKYLPQRLADAFQEAMADPEITSLRSEIGLLDARMVELIKKLDTGDSANAWDHVDGEIQLLRKSLEDNNSSQALMVAEKLQDFVRGANSERETWDSLHSVIEQRRRLTDTERKREEMLAATMTANQAITFVTTLQTAINDIVSDPMQRRRLGLRIAMILNKNTDIGTVTTAEPEDVEAEIIDDDSEEEST